MCEQLFTANFATFVLAVIVVIGIFTEHVVEMVIQSKQDTPS